MIRQGFSIATCLSAFICAQCVVQQVVLAQDGGITPNNFTIDVVGDQSDSIGRGRSFHLTSASPAKVSYLFQPGAGKIDQSTDLTVLVRFVDGSFTFSFGDNNPLRVGIYQDASSFPKAATNGHYLNVTSDISACQNSVGNFTINRIDAPRGLINIDFEAHCTGSQVGLHGSIVINLPASEPTLVHECNKINAALESLGYANQYLIYVFGAAGSSDPPAFNAYKMAGRAIGQLESLRDQMYCAKAKNLVQFTLGNPQCPNYGVAVKYFYVAANYLSTSALQDTGLQTAIQLIPTAASYLYANWAHCR